MRKLLVSFLIFVSVFNAGSVRQREARAVVPALAVAPEVAVGMLLLLATACALAARSGVVDAETARSYEADLRANAASLQNKIKHGIKVTAEAMAPIMLMMIRANQLVGGKAICDQVLARIGAGGVSPTKTNEARAASEGECEPSLRGSPYDCCPDFMKKLSSGRMTSVGRNAFRVFFYGRHAATHSCCYEWDSLHGRFEVYQQGNHQPIKHRGEKACARDQDLDEEDMCSPTFSDKADLLSQRHARGMDVLNFFTRRGSSVCMSVGCTDRLFAYARQK